jgi:cysteinyl-tRNA synthetase
MAKSLGNFISIKDFMARYKDADYLKLLFLNTHYRHPVDYTEAKITEMKAQKERFTILMGKISGKAKPSEEVESYKKKFEEAMDDDFNMPLALAHMFELVNFANKRMDDTHKISAAGAALVELARIFSLDLKPREKDLPATVEKLIAERNTARAKKDYKRSDEIRQELSGLGVVLEDTKDGTTWRKKA